MARQNQRKVVLAKQPGALKRRPARKVSGRGSTGRGTQGVNPPSLWQFASHHPGQSLSLLVIRSLGGIGDILMTTPAVRQLHEDFPMAKITYATDRHSTVGDDYYQLVKNAGFINEVLDVRRMNKAAYDAWVDITSVCIRYENGGTGPPLNRIDIFSRACGIPRLRNPLPFYQVEPEERAWALKTLAPVRADGKYAVFLHTASFDAKRCWPVSKYRELLDLAAVERPDVMFLVSDFNNVLPDRRNYRNVLDVTNPNIRELAATIGQADLFIGPDSGPMHIAGTLGVPSLALFGSIPYQARTNYYPETTAVTPPKYVCGGPCLYAKCQFNTRCMSDITTQHVLSLIP